LAQGLLEGRNPKRKAGKFLLEILTNFN